MKSDKLSASDYWTLFAQTGSPEAYMLYTRQLKMEEQDASYSEGSGPAGYGLQRS
ncbi:MAG: hypothetical protein ACI3V0_07515 [Faecousia sp.]